MLEKDEGRVCCRLEKAKVLVIKECFLLRVDTRTRLVLVHARWFDRDRVRTGVLPDKPKTFRWVHH